jgi:hypothetical protein
MHQVVDDLLFAPQILFTEQHAVEHVDDRYVPDVRCRRWSQISGLYGSDRRRL